MNSMFRIPALCDAIPAELVPATGHEHAVSLARCLLDAGVIHGDVDPRRAKEPLATSQAFLQQWVRDRLQALECLVPSFRLALEGASDACTSMRTRQAGEATIVWFTECSAFAVGQALERLEDVHPLLGATVLSVIDKTNMNLIPIFTPWDTLGTAQEYYWYGEVDESVALDEQCGDDPGARAALRQEMVTREKIDAAFPAWATQCPGTRKRLTRRAMQRIATDARSARVRRVAEHALVLDRLDLEDAFRPNADGWFIGYGAVLTWRPGDIGVRVFDDFANDAVQGDYCDWMGEFSFDVGEPQALSGWLQAMEFRLAGMRRLDALIHELSTGDWRRVPKGFR
jgi:PRTRC genetic system protein F